VKKKLSTYLDSKGFIGHFRPEDWTLEFGDGAQRIGFWGCSQFLKSPLEKHDGLKEIFEVQLQAIKWFSFEPRRHWDDSRWWGKKGYMSRDNFTPILCMILLFKFKDAALTVIWSHLVKRLGFFWNTKEIWVNTPKKMPIPDWLTPTILGLYFRAVCQMHWLFIPIFYPLVLVMDLGLCLNSVVRVLWPLVDPGHTSDDLNTICVLSTTMWVFPTPLSWLARKIYWWRPMHPNYGGLGPYTALESYFAGPNAPPLHLDWKPILERDF